jgi:deoxycytidine triphosphate deaminase
MAILYPRSSVNRRGLSVDLTGIVDSGYSGNLLIPLRNNTSAQVIRLYPGERFCQLVFEQIDGDFVHRKSRWHKRDVHMTIQKEQDNEETDLVRSGKIDSLKAKFGIHQI